MTVQINVSDQFLYPPRQHVVEKCTADSVGSIDSGSMVQPDYPGKGRKMLISVVTFILASRAKHHIASVQTANRVLFCDVKCAVCCVMYSFSTMTLLVVM